MAKLSKIYLKKLWTGYIKKFPNKQKQKKYMKTHDYDTTTQNVNCLKKMELNMYCF